MKKYYLMKTVMLTFMMLLMQNVFAQNEQVTVDSLEDLLPYLKQSNVNVKLEPGTYRINAFDVGSNRLFSTAPLFLFEGSNSVYDFTDVKLEINTLVFTKFGSIDVKEIQILGNNNVLKNLTMEDIGTTKPTKTALGIAMDGRDNLVEGFHMTTRGSYPYGYGDAFGKGGTNNIIGHKKHSSVLIRGLRNHLKNCTIISRSYGHVVFMQAASYPIVEGCYIEGEVRSTDDMLAEAGTGSPGDNVDFMTTWGYKLPAGYMMSLQEEGIRAYNAGTTYIDGEEIQRATDNPTVINCTVKNTRGGVTLAHASGKKYVENCTVIGCEGGYGIGTGIVLNCKADAAYGPVYKNTYSSDNGYGADITIIEPENGYYNGQKAFAYVGGSNHNLTFKSELQNVPSDMKIMMAGDLKNIRLLNGNNANQNNHTVNNVYLKNLTDIPVVIHSDASNSIVEGCAIDEVSDNGSSNTIRTIDCNSENFALAGAAIQSTTAYEGLANRAIDGNTNGNFSANSVTHTHSSDLSPWWLVNLDEEKVINEVVVYNRTGSNYGARLSDFTVSIINNQGDEVFQKRITTAPNPSVNIDVQGAVGKIVKISMNAGNALSLAEVQVFGSSLSSSFVKTNPIKVYPNPVSDQLQVSLNNTDLNFSKTTVSIYSVVGQKVFEMKLTEAKDVVSLNLSALNKGVYLLKINDTNKIFTQKLIKK